MLNSPVLNLVILLSFTYFIGSIMLSAINESISAGLKTRAKDLESTLKNLLLDPQWTTYVQGTILKSQHIQSLMNKDQQPSYIPAKNFLYTIIESIKAANYNGTNLQAGIDSSLLPQSMKDVLTSIWTKAQSNANAVKNSITIFEEEVEEFYNNAMERATGWYKRKTRRVMFILGFLLAASLNIDTIKITNDALSNKDQLEKTVDKIVEALPNITVNDSINIKTGKTTISIRQTIDSTKADSSKTGDSSKPLKKNIAETIKKTKQLQVFYDSIGGYQLGYSGWDQFCREWFGYAIGPGTNKYTSPIAAFILKVLGILLTAFALQLGSNYWFDLLNKAVNLRATGKKPEDAKNK